MTTERIDPLAVLNRLDGDMCLPGVGEVMKAVAAVAELVEADLELDEAREQVEHAMGRGRRHLLLAAMEWHYAAKARRAAALAAFGRQV